MLRGSLLGLALVSMLTGLAGPRWGFRWEEVERRGVDLVVALDLSRSMLSEDAKPNRLAAAKREMRDLIALLQGDRVGLVVFAGTALVQCPLTLDYGAFSVFLSQLNPNSVPVGGTDLAAAVRRATDTFVKEEHSGRAVLLITDGEDHGDELRKAAEEAKAQGVHVFVVGMGSPEGVPVPDGQGGFVKEAGRVVLSKLDEAGLKELALTTGGSYVRSTEGDMDLRKIYLEDIKQTLQSRSLSSSRQKRWEERYQPFLLLALLLLVLESTVGPPRRRREASEGRAQSSSASSAAAFLAGTLALGTLLSPSSAQAGWFSSSDPSHLAHAAFSDGRYSEALAEWLRAQTATPSDRRIDYNVGQAHYRLEDYPSAEASFRAATASPDPRLGADAWYGAGNAAFQQGRYPEAIAAFEECLELRPDDEDAEANRSLAQRRYEELLEQAQNDQEQEQQEQQQEQQEQQDDADADEQEQAEQSEDGDEGEKKEQQQGEAGQTEEPPPEEPDSAAENEDAQEGDAEEQTPEQQPETEEAPGGAAEAAEIDRQEDGTEEDEETAEGAIAEETVEDESAGEAAPPVVEGALSPEQAEALLRVLESDQARRRTDRTKRAGQRGRKAAGKDW
jgi:Ca-activated chloride channel family protein